MHQPGKGGQVVSMAVIVATGVTATGEREILGLDVGDSEDEVFWRAFLLSLKQRGLAGVRLVISDQHAGLVAALSRAFQGAAHQRCRVHFARNLLAHVPKGTGGAGRLDVPDDLRPAHPRRRSAAWDKTRDGLAPRWPKLGPYMDEAKAEVLAFTGFPREHWRKIWSTNPLERVNKEIKRRSRVVGIFPKPASVIRLVGAALIDMHDEWIAGDRRYLSEGSMAKLSGTSDTEPVAAIESNDV
ncbi:IS256 family transposase [Nocardioides sp. BSK12Z-4]|uniref:Mutator family transposase n=1 Tax=Nocardioides bruguierae TaxID=2945102 RepID=A0A9X2DB72_9ACTN|nr:IS256 family transposase [Nocardioides bruguierae]